MLGIERNDVSVFLCCLQQRLLCFSLAGDCCRSKSAPELWSSYLACAVTGEKIWSGFCRKPVERILQSIFFPFLRNVLLLSMKSTPSLLARFHYILFQRVIT